MLFFNKKELIMTGYYGLFEYNLVFSTYKEYRTKRKIIIEEYKKQKGIEIPENNYYTDYYTGKTFDRENYQKLISIMNKGDYLIVKEVDRLGRNWDLIKKEWTKLQDMGIKIIIIDISSYIFIF